MPPRIHSEVRTRLAGRRPRLAAAAPGGASTLLGTNRPLFLSQCAALPLLLAALQVLDSPQNATNVNGQAGSLHKQHAPLVSELAPADAPWLSPSS